MFGRIFIRQIFIIFNFYLTEFSFDIFYIYKEYLIEFLVGRISMFNNFYLLDLPLNEIVIKRNIYLSKFSVNRNFD